MDWITDDDVWAKMKAKEAARAAARQAQLRLNRLTDWQQVLDDNVRCAIGRWGRDRNNKITRISYADVSQGWWETERLWLGLHPPEIIPPTICAGCRQPLGAGPVITLEHYRIHKNWRDFCLNAFDEHRSMIARRALTVLGLNPTLGPVHPGQLRRAGKTAEAEALEQKLSQEYRLLLARLRDHGAPSTG
jgi:hypothetical protein